MCIRTLTTLTTLVLLIGLSHAEKQHEVSAEESDMDKRSLDGYYMPQRSSNWISSRPLKSLNSAANEDIGYLLQYLDKRSGEFSDNLEGDRSIRSPLGTMRFGKRASGPLGTMRFGKRAANPLQTMRFGRRR